MADLLNRPGLNTQTPQAQDNTNEYFEPDNYNRIFNQVSNAIDKAKQDKAKQEKASLEKLIGSNRDVSTLTPEEKALLKNTECYSWFVTGNGGNGLSDPVSSKQALAYLLHMPYEQFMQREPEVKKQIDKYWESERNKSLKAEKEKAQQSELARQSWADMEYEQKDQANNHEKRKQNMRTAPNNIATPEKQDQWEREYKTTQNILGGMREGPDNRFQED